MEYLRQISHRTNISIIHQEELVVIFKRIFTKGKDSFSKGRSIISLVITSQNTTVGLKGINIIIVKLSINNNNNIIYQWSQGLQET